MIRTTNEHPFWVVHQGWVRAGSLGVGDMLLSHDGQIKLVEDVLNTGEYETVYNVRVADDHTYFVGGTAWGFSVWAHNAGCALAQELRSLGSKVTDIQGRAILAAALREDADAATVVARLRSSLAAHEDEGLSLPGRWVYSQDVRPGDMLYTSEGRCRRVDAVDVRELAEEQVCNLAVHGRHYYAVGECAVLVHNQSWCDILAKKVGNKPQPLLDIIRKNGWSASFIHGHHIVMQAILGANDSRKWYVEAAQAILAERQNAIPLLATKAEAAAASDTSNLCYAINNRDGIHSLAYVKEVYLRLEAANADGPVAVRKALAEMKRLFEKGVSFWVK